MASLLYHLRHWFTPHHSNNYRARLLHNGSLAVIIGLTIGASALIRILESSPLHVLGFTSSVTIDEVVMATNRERLAAGLTPLKYSDTLEDAARRKAANMFAENYWAHNSPSGKTPWVWFNQAGYKYTYAGENLAKDFGNTDRLMEAWMNSPTHKANIVSDKYQEIGVAVVPGSLVGGETVLVVQLFGSTESSGAIAPAVSEVTGAQLPTSLTTGQYQGANTRLPVMQVANSLSGFTLKKIAGISLALLLLLALVADLVIAENQRLSRRVGKNWGHIIVLNVILILVVIAHAGSIQ